VKVLITLRPLADHEFLIHFTGTTPEKMRYRLLNVDANQGVKLTVWYSRPNRLDVFVDGQYVIATNARIDANDRYIISMPTGVLSVLSYSFVGIYNFNTLYIDITF